MEQENEFLFPYLGEDTCFTCNWSFEFFYSLHINVCFHLGRDADLFKSRWRRTGIVPIVMLGYQVGPDVEGERLTHGIPDYLMLGKLIESLLGQGRVRALKPVADHGKSLFNGETTENCSRSVLRYCVSWSMAKTSGNGKWYTFDRVGRKNKVGIMTGLMKR